MVTGGLVIGMTSLPVHQSPIHQSTNHQSTIHQSPIKFPVSMTIEQLKELKDKLAVLRRYL